MAEESTSKILMNAAGRDVGMFWQRGRLSLGESDITLRCEREDMRISSDSEGQHVFSEKSTDIPLPIVA